MLLQSLFQLYPIFFTRALVDGEFPGATCSAGESFYLERTRASKQSVVAIGSREVKLTGDGCTARTPDLPGGVADQANRRPAKKSFSPNSMRQGFLPNRSPDRMSEVEEMPTGSSGGQPSALPLYASSLPVSSQLAEGWTILRWFQQLP